MLLLVSKSLPELRRIDHARLGMLMQPRNYSDPQRFVDAGIPWAADNDAFQGFQVGPYLKMLGTLAGKPDCLFVTAPDVVADWESTLVLWEIYWPVIHDADLPAAIVLQDGARHIPPEADAVFIGGSTEWKLSDPARQLVYEAKSLGLWVHMGRVNSNRRLELAASWGVDSVDGTGWARYFDTHIARGLTWAGSGQQQLANSTEEKR